MQMQFVADANMTRTADLDKRLPTVCLLFFLTYSVLSIISRVCLDILLNSLLYCFIIAMKSRLSFYWVHIEFCPRGEQVRRVINVIKIMKRSLLKFQSATNFFQYSPINFFNYSLSNRKYKVL